MKWDGSLELISLILGAFGNLFFAILVVFKIKIFELVGFEFLEVLMRKKEIEKNIALIALISLALSFAIQIYLQLPV